MSSFSLCQFKSGICPSKSAKSELCKTETIVGCDLTCLCNICHLHQFKDWTWATRIINRLTLLSGEETAGKVFDFKNIWELTGDLDVSLPRSSAMCCRYSSLRVYLTHRRIKLPTNTNLGFLWRGRDALPTAESSGLRPPALMGPTHLPCQAPTWGGVRAEPAAEHLQLLLGSHQWACQPQMTGLDFSNKVLSLPVLDTGNIFSWTRVWMPLWGQSPKSSTHGFADVQVLPYSHS